MVWIQFLLLITMILIGSRMKGIGLGVMGMLGMLLFAAGESVFHGTSFSLGVPNDFNLMLWLLAYVLFGAVAMHPDMKKLMIPRVSKESSHMANVLTLLLPLVLLMPVTLLIIYFKAL